MIKTRLPSWVLCKDALGYWLYNWSLRWLEWQIERYRIALKILEERKK